MTDATRSTANLQRRPGHATPAGLRRSANNFDALRFWAALAVLWSHAFPLSDGSEKHEPLFAASQGQATFGMVAVTLFFVLSGFLITRSFERRTSAVRFVLARVLRIMPGLLVVLFLVAFVLGPLVSVLTPHEYFASSGPFRYFAHQASFWRFYDVLPGVFTSNPMFAVNGSLWTLRFEVECYVLVFLLGTLGLLNRYTTLVLYLAGLLYLFIHEPHYPSDGLHLAEINQHVNLTTQFLAGALVYQWRVPLKASAAWSCLALTIGCLMLGHLGTALRSLIPYVVMYLAMGTSLRLASLARFGDLSYGIYIYAWPVQQLVVMYSPWRHWLVIASVATPIVLMLAWLSWHGVERVALSFKNRLRLPFGLEQAGVPEMRSLPVRTDARPR